MAEDRSKQAASLFAQGIFDEAERLYAAIAADIAVPAADRAVAHGNRAAAFAKEGKWEASRDAALASVALDPAYAKAHGRLGAAFHALKRFEEAAGAYERAAALQPGNESYRAELGEMRKLVGEGRGIASDATKEQYYFSRAVEQGTAAMKAEKFADAVKHFSKAIDHAGAAPSVRDTAIVFANRSAAHLKLGDAAAAKADAEASVGRDGRYARAHTRLGLAVAALGEYSVAVEHFNRSLALEPGNDVATKGRAASEKAIEGEKAKAAEAARKADESRAAMNAAKASAATVDASGPSASAKAPAAAMLPLSGSRHQHSFDYCRLCSSYGHTARNCPMRASNQGKHPRPN